MNQISDYVRNNMLPQINDRPMTNSVNNNVSSLNFQDLLMENLQMMMSMNQQPSEGNDSPFSSSFSMPSSGLMPSFDIQSLGNKMGEAISSYQNAAHMDQPIAISTGTSQPTTLHKEPPTNQYNDLIEQAARKYNVDVNLIHSIIKMESNYDPNVKSHVGAVGLMQLMPSTAKAVGVTDRHDIAQNIDGGVHYFSKMLHNQKGNIKLALAAYNAGPGNVKKHGGVPPFQETQNYIKKVMDYYQA